MCVDKVYFHLPLGRWEARIGIPGSKHIYLGLHSDEDGAARAYDGALVLLTSCLLNSCDEFEHLCAITYFNLSQKHNAVTIPDPSHVCQTCQ